MYACIVSDACSECGGKHGSSHSICGGNVASAAVCLSVPDILSFECPLSVAFSTPDGGGTYVLL